MKKIKNWQRYILEWGSLAAIIVFVSTLVTKDQNIDVESYCPFGGIQSLANYLTTNSLPCGMNSMQIFAGIALLTAVVLFGKLFCAYICPLGTIGNLVMRLRKRCNIPTLPIPTSGVFDKILRSVKYVLLFVILYYTLQTGELFCKRFDPYYTMATVFNGEMLSWVSIVMLLVFLLGSLFVDSFWCKYICPLGALSNTFKYWLWMVSLLGVLYIGSAFSLQYPIEPIIAIFCGMGYLLEIFMPNTSLQILNVYKNPERCSGCKNCEEKCPFHINIASYGNQIENVDCMLCGECVENCPSKALHIGAKKNNSKPKIINRLLPAALSIALVSLVFIIGERIEIPTIDEYWGPTLSDTHNSFDTSTFNTLTLEGLSQVRCYKSSMIFRDRLKQIEGVYGLKTFVKHHRAIISYDSSLTNPDKIQQELFVPRIYQISVPDYKRVSDLRIITILVDNMTRPNAINLLGLRFKQVDSLIYGLETEWNEHTVVKMYVDPLFSKGEEWIRDIVSSPDVELNNNKTGKTVKMEMGFEYVGMKQHVETIRTSDFLNRMFKPFRAEFNSIDNSKSNKQEIYEIAESGITKPVFLKYLSLLASVLGAQDGIDSIYTCLADNYVPVIRINFHLPMTVEKLEDVIYANEWTIQEADGLHTITVPLKLQKGKILK